MASSFKTGYHSIYAAENAILEDQITRIYLASEGISILPLAAPSSQSTLLRHAVAQAHPKISVFESTLNKTIIFSIKKMDENVSLAFVNKIASKQHNGLNSTAGETLKRLRQLAIDNGSTKLHVQFAVQNHRIYELCRRHFKYVGQQQNPFTEVEALFHTFEIPLIK